VSRLSRLVVSWLAAIALLGLWLVPTPSQAVSKPTAKYATVKVAAAEGGTKITITGKNLKKVSAIYFGSTKTTKITHVSATKLKVTAPKHVPGTVKLKLRAGKRTYTTKLKITYVVTKISPTATEAEVLRLTNAAPVKRLHLCGRGLRYHHQAAGSRRAELECQAGLRRPWPQQRHGGEELLSPTPARTGRLSPRASLAPATSGARWAKILPPAIQPRRGWWRGGWQVMATART